MHTPRGFTDASCHHEPTKTAREKFGILNRFTGAVQVSVEIECKPNELPSIKLGFAVKAAIKCGANLEGANLCGVNLCGAYLCGANFDGANFDGANFEGACLDGANLEGASLCGVNLCHASLEGANFEGANFDGACLDGANFEGANFDGANFEGACLCGVKVKKLIARVTRGDGYVFFCWHLDDARTVVRAGCRTMTTAEYRKHVAANYPGTDKATETTQILDFMELRVASLKEGA
jgi:uncharacterized protein YjbI with pentapeptide repeats